MGFWILVPGLLMGGSEPAAASPIIDVELSLGIARSVDITLELPRTVELSLEIERTVSSTFGLVQ